MDMLIKLYDLPAGDSSSHHYNTLCRKPLAPEYYLIVDWVAREFTAGWASEARAALSNRPVSLYVAIQEETPVGFCCYDATARGFVGPIGVATNARRSGVGAALLQACLHDMRSVGYAYAIAGAVGAPEFFRSVAGAIEIEGSTPGIYRDMLRPAAK
jgi:ribosomal protein S18 acetylase RimI-like enzyme